MSSVTALTLTDVGGTKIFHCYTKRSRVSRRASYFIAACKFVWLEQEKTSLHCRTTCLPIAHDTRANDVGKPVKIVDLPRIPTASCCFLEQIRFVFLVRGLGWKKAHEKPTDELIPQCPVAAANARSCTGKGEIRCDLCRSGCYQTNVQLTRHSAPSIRASYRTQMVPVKKGRRSGDCKTV